MTRIARTGAGARIPGLALGFGLALAVGLGPVSTAAAAVDAAVVRAAVAKKFNVKVLKVAAVTVDGKAAFKVTVMYPGGNFNTAFQVNTLIIDANTGEAISVFRHIASGHISASGGDTAADRQPVDALRTTPWR
ncbi:MAG: hypothetical protein ACTSUD_00115 [Alphaproteobacteria bacterium]